MTWLWLVTIHDLLNQPFLNQEESLGFYLGVQIFSTWNVYSVAFKSPYERVFNCIITINRNKNKWNKVISSKPGYRCLIVFIVNFMNITIIITIISNIFIILFIKLGLKLKLSAFYRRKQRKRQSKRQGKYFSILLLGHNSWYVVRFSKSGSYRTKWRSTNSPTSNGTIESESRQWLKMVIGRGIRKGINSFCQMSVNNVWASLVVSASQTRWKFGMRGESCQCATATSVILPLPIRPAASLFRTQLCHPRLQLKMPSQSAANNQLWSKIWTFSRGLKCSCICNCTQTKHNPNRVRLSSLIKEADFCYTFLGKSKVEWR